MDGLGTAVLLVGALVGVLGGSSAEHRAGGWAYLALGPLFAAAWVPGVLHQRRLNRDARPSTPWASPEHR
jgi:hypothetical protein